MAIRTGTLRHWLFLESPSTTQDDAGQPQDNWFSETAGFFSIVPITAKEAIESGRQVGEVSHMVKGRYNPEITSDKRLSDDNGRRFYIVSVTNVEERNRELRMECLERV